MDIPKAIPDVEIKHTKLFINNEWVDSKDGSTFSVEDPATASQICCVAEAKMADVDAAVAAAREAFKPGSAWRKTTPKQRGELMHKLADLMERDRHYLASLESLNGGKLYVACYLGDIQHAIDVIRYFAGWADKDHGKTIPWDDSHFAYTRHEPMGVCGAIIPWNAAIVMFSWKFAPCIASGNVLVMKPAEQTPLTALYLGSLIKEAGFPPGVINIVPGFGLVAGGALSHHMDVDKIAFTGSTATGRLIQKASAESNLKRVSLELGGKSPNIILADADLDNAVEMANFGIFYHNGQMCCAGSRIFVQEEIYDKFVEKSVHLAKTGQIGNPRDLTTKHGPQISKLQKDRILGFLRRAKKQGCTVLCGGDAVGGTKGHYIQPTVLTDITDDMEISKDEVFGPVQQIYKFKDLAEVIKRANNTKYGLAAGVFTKDINKAVSLANSLEAGVVWINTYIELNPTVPFGGFKMSGIGRDMSAYALQDYTQVKVVIAKLSSGSP